MRRLAALALVAACDSSASPYAGSQRCASCHPAEYAAWQGSHHALAMQVASDATVLGDFANATIEHRGKWWRLSRRGGEYVVTAEGPDGELHDYTITYTFGIDPLQQYLVAFPGGRQQVLPVAWNTRARRWFVLDAARGVEPTDWLYWARPGQTWNTMCADCHATNLEKRYDAAQDTFDTQFAELAVGCEACHGPSARHAVMPAAQVPVAAPRGPELVEQCAACHARRAAFADRGAVDQPLLDRAVPALMSAGVFYPDGQILDEDFEVQSFWQSKMYSKGVTCRDCHDVHSGKLRADGNALCTRCHDASFDTPAHTRHVTEPATRCVSCHMPGRNYMVVHFRRDHSLRVPRPDLTDASESASACTGCHERPVWAFAKPRPDHWGPVLAAGRRGAPEAFEPLAALATDDNRPAIVRASAIELLGGYRAVPHLDALLDDREPLVRLAAASHLPVSDPARLARLCNDSLRAIRVAAAARLARAPVCRSSLDEYVAIQKATSDMPSGPFNLGNLYAALDEDELAERAYRRALAIDGQLVQAQVNLALLVARRGRTSEAEALLRAALASQPRLAPAAFNLGLLLAEQGRRGEAEAALRDALAADPDLAAAAYNLGVLVQRERPDEAHTLFLRAARLRPEESRYVEAAEATRRP